MNLKWNIDGKGFKTPPQKFLGFVKSKRNEFHLLNITTYLSVVLAATVLSIISGDATKALVLSIVGYNAVGLAVGYALSFAAK